jgi:hypothetical protein
MENWNSIYFWIHGLGYPEDNDVYAKFLNSSINAQSYTESAKGY